MITLLLLLFFFWPLLILAIPPVWGLGRGDTLIYTGGQLLSWWATIAGWGLLAWPCYKQMWVLGDWSINTVRAPRNVSEWAEPHWAWLNKVWGNPEDGVSGVEAVLGDGSPYLPGASPGWRAYRWSALRNSADGLKYLLANDRGRLVLVKIFGRQVKFGWLPMPQVKGAPRVPVLG